jgi:hypothetical protein
MPKESSSSSSSLVFGSGKVEVIDKSISLAADNWFDEVFKMLSQESLINWAVHHIAFFRPCSKQENVGRHFQEGIDLLHSFFRVG